MDYMGDLNKILDADPTPDQIKSESLYRQGINKEKQTNLTMWSSGIRVDNSALSPPPLFKNSS